MSAALRTASTVGALKAALAEFDDEDELSVKGNDGYGNPEWFSGIAISTDDEGLIQLEPADV